MLCFARRKIKAALAWPSNTLTRIKANRKALAKFSFRLFVFLFAIAMGISLFTTMEFPVSQGDLSYQLAIGTAKHGYVQFLLGPIGSVNFQTHAVPINLKMNLVLNRDITTGQDLPDTVETKVKKFKYDAVGAFIVFLIVRVAFIAAIGAAAGVMLSNGGEHWFKWKYVKWCTICFVVPALVLIGISYLTLDRTPNVSYTGEIAQDLSKAAPYVKKVAEGYQLKIGLLQNFVNGAVILNDQMNSLASRGQYDTGTHILVTSDVHDSTTGMQMAGQIINDPGKPFGEISALILAGDITNAGYGWEAHLFDGSLPIGKKRVYFDGGNHESSSAMTAFGRMGYILLTSQEVNIGGVTVIGQSDPTAYNSELVATPQQLSDSSKSLAEGWNQYADPPNVVVVHDIAQVQEVISHAKADGQNLTVVYGHDHKVGNKTEGAINLIDCGTGGASGLDGVSRGESYSFQILDFSSGLDPHLTGVWTLQIYGLDDQSRRSLDYYPIK